MPLTFVKYKMHETWFEGPGRARSVRGAAQQLPETGAPGSRGRLAPPPEARPLPAAPATAVASRGVRGGPLTTRRSEGLEGKLCPDRGVQRPGLGKGGARCFRLGGGPRLGLPATAAAWAAWAGEGGFRVAFALPTSLPTPRPFRASAPRRLTVNPRGRLPPRPREAHTPGSP